jgi:hypothetical protein
MRIKKFKGYGTAFYTVFAVFLALLLPALSACGGRRHIASDRG